MEIIIKSEACCDDVLTDVLIDRVGERPGIRKNQPYEPIHDIEAAEIQNVIQAHIITRPDIATAERALLSIEGIRKFYRRLKPPSQMHFRGHLRRYLQTYLADCPFDITSTNRYDPDREDASITARRHIPRGSTVAYLNGYKVYVSPEEEDTITNTGMDFSIVYSTYKKRNYIFLGPARFVNHDCDPNAELASNGDEIRVTTTKAIDPAEEITLYYGEHYFGKYNSECLCATCEKEGLNGWAGKGRQPGDYKATLPRITKITYIPKPDCLVVGCRRERLAVGHKRD